MKRHNVRAAVAASIVGASLLAAPTAASAATIYPPSNACSASPSTVAAGESVQFACEPGTFAPLEQVTITVTGESGDIAGFGMVRLAPSTGSDTRTSTDAGALGAVRITLPADASGIYNIEAISASSAGGTASASVSGTVGLSGTGGDSGPVIGMLIGGSVLVVGGIAVAAVAAARRKSRQG